MGKLTYPEHDANLLLDKYRSEGLLFEFAPSWWKQDEQGGYPTQYFIDLVHPLQTQPNWTNCYEVCRDAFEYPSQRIQKEIGHDLYNIVLPATLEQLEYMQNDPHFPKEKRADLNHFIRWVRAGHPRELIKF
jgi:hypothetical protein